MSLQRIWLVVAACLCLTVALFEASSWDMSVQHLFYNSASGQWLWPKHEPILKAILYDGIKVVMILCAIAITIILLVARKNPLVVQYRTGLLIVLLSMLLVPATVATLKQLTNMACPCKLQEFGGKHVYVKLFQPQATENRRFPHQECYPAAHASVGFSLVSLFFLFKSRKNRWIGLAFGLLLGWTMGLYKMAIGDHFLSHTLVSMELAWLISSGIAIVFQRIAAKGKHSANVMGVGIEDSVSADQ